MLKNTLSLVLSLLIVFSNISFLFSISASAKAGENLITLTEDATVTTIRSTTADSRKTGWSRSSGGSASVIEENGDVVAVRTGQGGGQLFTNTFTIEKNSTYEFSFEIKGGTDNEYSYTNSSDVTLARGINFVIQDFNVLKDGTTAYNMYAEGKTDYAHTSKLSDYYPLRSGVSLTWTVELPDGTNTSHSATKYTSFGRKFGTAEGENDFLKALDLDEFYSDWRTISCVMTVPDDDDYTSSDIALGFVLPGNATDMYVKNICFAKNVEKEPIPETIPISIFDAEGNAYHSADDITASTTVIDNGDDTYTLDIDFDTMDGVNIFDGYYEGDTLISVNESCTVGDDVDLNNVTARIVCNSVITGGLGFESYTSTTSLRVDPAQSGTPPYGDKWGIWSNYTTDSENSAAGYENIDWDFDIKAQNGPLTTQYCSEFSITDSAFVTNSVTVNPYSGNSMFYFGARSRSIVRKLDNLKPDTNYQISFYTYNLSKWDFFYRAIVSDTYDMKTGTVTSSDTLKVYNYYVEPTVINDANQTIISDESKVQKWYKVTLNFTTDSDDNELYLHLDLKYGKNSSSTCKQFIDNLTVHETVFKTVGNAIRSQSEDLPQALRYKFCINKNMLNGSGDLTNVKVGILAAKSSNVTYDNMVIGGEYVFDGESKSIVDATVDPDKNFTYIEDEPDNVYFTAALYNIGAKDGAIDYNAYCEDYSVRPYVLYESDDGRQQVCYGDILTANVFDVMYAIVSSYTDDDDVTTAKEMLNNDELAEIYYDWQPTDGWYIGESRAEDYSYSFAVVGDIQKTTGYYSDKLHYIYDWIIDNADDKNIQYVMGLGDITEWKVPSVEWPIAVEQLERLKAAGINQSIVRGNHDGTKYFDQYITVDKFGDELSGTFDGTMNNTYRLITINGIKYMMLTLNLFPSDDEVAWAEELVASHPDYNVILTTHAYFDHDTSLTTDADIDWVSDRVSDGEEATLNSGEEIFDKLVSKYSNIVLVMCGHRYPPEYGPYQRVTTREDGSKVVEMMINPQKMESDFGRSFGMIAMLYISDDGKSVQLEYFSSITGLYYKDKFQFDFKLDLVD